MESHNSEQIEVIAREICQREHFGPESKGHGCGGKCQALFWYGERARSELSANADRIERMARAMSRLDNGGTHEDRWPFYIPMAWAAAAVYLATNQ